MPRLKDLYREQVVQALEKELAYDNVMQVPRLDKIVVNVGMGEALQNARALDAAVQDITTITGQKPIVTRARKHDVSLHWGRDGSVPRIRRSRFAVAERVIDYQTEDFTRGDARFDLILDNVGQYSISRMKRSFES